MHNVITAEPLREHDVLRRIAALCAISSALIMLLGAILLMASGADLDRALAEDAVATYLQEAAEAHRLLVTNLTLWILGVTLWGVAGVSLSRLPAGRPVAALLGRYCYHVGIPLVVASYVAWLAVVVQLGGADTAEAVTVGEVVGWFASRADWVATILVAGFGPALLAYGGQGTWAPRWLLMWGAVAALGGVLTALAMLTGGSGLLSYGFLIIPVGLGWMIATGVVLLRKRPELA